MNCDIGQQMTDEFSGRSVNTKKWMKFSPFSAGTPPSVFLPRNVVGRKHGLHLQVCEEETPQGVPEEYKGWTSAAIVSRKWYILICNYKKERVCAKPAGSFSDLICDSLLMDAYNWQGATALYGYFESCILASDSALASRFTLCKQNEEWNEIDIFTYSAQKTQSQYVYMDATVGAAHPSSENILSHPLARVIFDMPDTPVVIGLDWTPDYLKTYIDGQLIRHLENK